MHPHKLKLYKTPMIKNTDYFLFVISLIKRAHLTVLESSTAILFISRLLHELRYRSGFIFAESRNARPCKTPCSLHVTCENCTSQATECMWCGSTKRCVDSNAYVISFPYGQCLEWQTGDCVGKSSLPVDSYHGERGEQ